MFPVDSKILIVDDSSFARQSLKSALREMKYWKIIEANDAKAAQVQLEAEAKSGEPVHLVIADIHMPEMTGLQLLKWIRSRPDMKALPFIVLTSSPEKGDILEAGKLGASSYIIKPFDPSTLRDRMSATWNKYGQKSAAAKTGE